MQGMKEHIITASHLLANFVVNCLLEKMLSGAMKKWMFRGKRHTAQQER
jgi:hypothetical protein